MKIMHTFAIEQSFVTALQRMWGSDQLFLKRYPMTKSDHIQQAQRIHGIGLDARAAMYGQQAPAEHLLSGVPASVCTSTLSSSSSWWCSSSCMAVREYRNSR